MRVLLAYGNLKMNHFEIGGFKLKKILMTSAMVALLLAGCRDSDENRDLEDTPDELEDQTEEVADVEATDDEDQEEGSNTLVGAITDHDSMPLEEYDADKYKYVDTSSLAEFIENEVFVEENGIYTAGSDSDAMALTNDFSIRWSNPIVYGYGPKLAIDDTFLFNPSVGSDRSEGGVRAINKDSGEVAYEIPLGNAEEISEILVDDNSVYLAIGNLADPDDMFPEVFTLHAYDKADGNERWMIEDFGGFRISGKRPHLYEMTDSDDLIYIFGLDQDENQVLMALSKEDGSEVWSENFGDEEIRHSRTYLSDDSVYVMSRDYMIYAFDEETGERQAEYPYEGDVPGAEIPFPVLDDGVVYWQDATKEHMHLKAVDPKAGEELWSIDMDGHFLVDYDMLDDTLYAFFGSLDYDAEENTLMARIDPETGEILTLVDLGVSISEKFNSYNRSMGLTVHNDNLAFYRYNDMFIFNE